MDESHKKQVIRVAEHICIIRERSNKVWILRSSAWMQSHMSITPNWAFSAHASCTNLVVADKFDANFTLSYALRVWANAGTGTFNVSCGLKPGASRVCFGSIAKRLSYSDSAGRAMFVARDCASRADAPVRRMRCRSDLLADKSRRDGAEHLRCFH
jgi:hypothetical protein